ncbi:helix-turn-helix domain-containing GNAT family N-acetyltransferase [Curvivirga aplysinae]|uniref:helix-turn-helix domain-containing GNAT family N-acetyltransferase n=1 Tax=Curvivirga aplysinae TaxID=2529852 RepID=UPI0012BB7116|nr:helix-turn-helix domain-containing GNAT family N-acetyltransferase [Curvivirga aplysinae]MTI09190.1 MarR family transcriptional regulator [Curvivirga aplysinae]
MTKLLKIDEIRSQSRALVRELGFMRRTLAGTTLSPSATHSIIEIGLSENLTAKDLSNILKLDKSSVSRLIQKLFTQGYVIEKRAKHDGRKKELTLTDEGQKIYNQICEFGRNQVSNAINQLPKEDIQKIIDGLNIYASALSSSKIQPKVSKMHLVTGYFPGLIGQIAKLHGVYYTKHAGFDVNFEAAIAAETGELFCNMQNTKTQVWSYLDGDKGDLLVASITIEDVDHKNGKAHLRWFIAEEAYHGYGMGRRLMKAAMDYCDREGFKTVTLSTFAGLDAAIKLYEDFEFKLTDEFPSMTWGKEVLEKHYRRDKA